MDYFMINDMFERIHTTSLFISVKKLLKKNLALFKK